MEFFSHVHTSHLIGLLGLVIFGKLPAKKAHDVEKKKRKRRNCDKEKESPKTTSRGPFRKRSCCEEGKGKSKAIVVR